MACLAPCTADIWDEDELGTQGRSHPRPLWEEVSCLVCMQTTKWGRQRAQATNEGDARLLWLWAHCEGHCRCQSVDGNKWEECDVEAVGNDSLSCWKTCTSGKNRCENGTSNLRLWLISRAGMMENQRTWQPGCNLTTFKGLYSSLFFIFGCSLESFLT